MSKSNDAAIDRMNEERGKARQSRYYKLAQLEMALVSLRQIVARPQENRSLYLTPMQSAMLLECARLGAAQMYQNQHLTDFYYPLP